MRHVPGGELEDRSTPFESEDRSTPFEPEFVSTEAYIVGNERPYNPNNQSEIIERYLRNEKHRSPPAVPNTENNRQQQQDVRRQSENFEDLGQEQEDFNGQHEEDVQQQLYDLNQEAEGLTQQQVNINHDDNRYYAATKDYQNEYNSHYHGAKESAHEYEAEVVQVTDKADAQSEESPGLWRRLKEKTKEIFG